jgi:hypothetical protein
VIALRLRQDKRAPRKSDVNKKKNVTASTVDHDQARATQAGFGLF